MNKEKIVNIEIRKSNWYYHLFINGKEMPELYNEEEVVIAVKKYMEIWSKKKIK